MILKNYKQSWKFIKDSKIYLWIIAALFFASAVFGFLFPYFFLDFIRKFIEEIVAETEGLNYYQLFLFILQNNLWTALVAMILGVFLGIPVLVLCFFNGYVLGFVANKTAAAAGYLILFKLLPHGIFEIPALILSLGLGLRMGWFVFTKDKSSKKFLLLLEKSLKTFLFVVIPLLIIAALLESSLMIFFT